MSDKKKKLQSLQLTEVSLVREGANEGANILFYKNKDGAPTQTAQETNVPFDINVVPENVRKTVQDEITRLENELKVAKTAPPPVAPVVEPDPDPTPDVPEAIQKHLNRQSAEIETLRKALAAKEEAEFIAVAKSELSNIPEVETIAKGLFVLSKSNAELADQVRRALSSAQAIAKNAAKVLTVEKGKAGASAEAESPLGKAEKLAKALQDKTPGMSFAKALTQVYRENPGLYDEYTADNQ